MFGTRAHVIVDLTFCVTLVAPALAFASMRLARGRQLELHRRIQLALLALCVAAVLALEIQIRLAGGSGALVQGSPFAETALMRTALWLHMGGAVLTYAVWGTLAGVSVARYRRVLPGRFSALHRRAGTGVFAGLCFTAVSAAVVYTLAFVA
jgi:putative membrane protein